MLLALAAAAILASDPAGACRAARAPLPATATVAAEDRVPVEAYRAAWRRACDGRVGAADLGALLGDAEALAEDVGTAPALEAIASALGPGADWPLPGLRREGGGPLRVDWASFAAAAEHGTAEDARFWRGAAVAAGPFGDPAWQGEAVAGGPARCLRLADTRWRDVAEAIDAMERGGSKIYALHVKMLRARLLETLTALARDRQVCACLPGDAAAALDSLAADGTPARPASHERRVLAKAAREAVAAVRAGRIRILALRSAPGAPPTGCAP